MDTRRRCQLCTSTTTNMACYYVSPTCRPESVKRAIATEFLRLLVQPSPLTLSINTFTTTSSGVNTGTVSTVSNSVPGCAQSLGGAYDAWKSTCMHHAFFVSEWAELPVAR